MKHNRINAPIAYIREKIYVRRDIAEEVDYRRIFSRDIFKETKCASCINREFRPNDLCWGCNGWTDHVEMYEVKRIKGVEYVGVPWGDQKAIENIFDFDFDDRGVKDQRATPPMPHKLKWVKPLYTGNEKINGMKTANQVGIVHEWVKHRGGIIEASPRTGKSTMAAYIGTRLGLRVLIVTHDTALSKQMANEYIQMTNVKKVAERKGLKVEDLVLLIEKPSQITREKLENACVVAVNYQKFIYSKKRVKLMRKMFGIMFVDEVHQASATAYANFVNSIAARYRCGLSATPERRDGRHVIGRMLIGPVVVRSATSAMIPGLSLVKTGIGLPPSAGKPRDGGLKYLATSMTRNKMIVDNVMKDLEDGHEGVIIPVGSLEHMRTLRELFIKRFNDDKPVLTYYGGINKQKRIEEFEQRGKVLIAMWQMIKQGVTLKKPTSMHLVLPRADGHMFYQLTNRVCTPVEGKRKPIIRIYVDEVGISRGCFNLILFNEILPRRRGNKDRKSVRYDVTPQELTRFMNLVHDRLDDGPKVFGESNSGSKRRF